MQFAKYQIYFSEILYKDNILLRKNEPSLSNATNIKTFYRTFSSLLQVTFKIPFINTFLIESFTKQFTLHPPNFCTDRHVIVYSSQCIYVTFIHCNLFYCYNPSYIGHNYTLIPPRRICACLSRLVFELSEALFYVLFVLPPLQKTLSCYRKINNFKYR